MTVMAVVDETDGRYVVASGGMRPQVIPTDAKLKKDSKSDIVRFEHPMSFAQALLVRPGKGAWVGRAEDAAHEGKVNLQFEGMTSSRGAGKSASPAKLLPKDVLIVIDPTSLQFYAYDVKDKD
jgi:hypothetical protein